MRLSRSFAVGAVALLCATAALASWYDDYDAGVNASRTGNWNLVIQKMTAAINGNPKENDRARTYGAIFINYHPYYYRGVAYLQLNKYEQAVSDLEKTTGSVPDDLGSLDSVMQRAKAKLSASQTPAPAPQPPAPAPAPAPVPVTPHPVTPTPAPVPQPVAPSVDPALRGQVQGAINEANGALGAARGRKAGSSQPYLQAIQALAEANSRLGSARSNDDLNAALGSARNAKLFADAATGPAAPPSPVPTIPITQTRPNAAANTVLADASKRVRGALEKYFAGEFEDSTRQFQQLTTEMPKNAWLWAFLGASQYSQYAFEADDNYKTAALESFRKAKTLRRWDGGLPQKYFSKRIRKVFDTPG
jgi:tetratricopeptide (TPR) repeat protein